MTTWQTTDNEAFDLVDPTLARMRHVLVIELKKGGFELTHKEIDQADGQVLDIAASGAVQKPRPRMGQAVGHRWATKQNADLEAGVSQFIVSSSCS